MPLVTSSETVLLQQRSYWETKACQSRYGTSLPRMQSYHERDIRTREGVVGVVAGQVCPRAIEKVQDLLDMERKIGHALVNEPITVPHGRIRQQRDVVLEQHLETFGGGVHLLGMLRCGNHAGTAKVCARRDWNVFECVWHALPMLDVSQRDRPVPALIRARTIDPVALPVLSHLLLNLGQQMGKRPPVPSCRRRGRPCLGRLGLGRLRLRWSFAVGMIR